MKTLEQAHHEGWDSALRAAIDLVKTCKQIGTVDSRNAEALELALVALQTKHDAKAGP